MALQAVGGTRTGVLLYLSRGSCWLVASAWDVEFLHQKADTMQHCFRQKPEKVQIASADLIFISFQEQALSAGPGTLESRV